MNGRRLAARISRLVHVDRRRALLNILILFVILVSSGLVALSPLVLGYLNVQKSTDWDQLSDIGQTYGAASALLAGFALLGIAASLILQAKEAKATREQALRALHSDLISMAMEDPLYRACWGQFFSSDDEDAQRAHMYVNMIVSHWLLMWELNAITEEHLRAIASVVLSGRIGHTFWSDGRELRVTSAGTKHERRFNQILDEEYHKAPVPSAPPVADQAIRHPTDGAHQRTLYGAAGVAVLGTVGIAAAKRLMKTRGRTRD